VVTGRELIEIIVRETGRSRLLLPLPAGIARLLALPMAILPNPMLTADRVTLLNTDNVVSELAVRERRTLAGLGVTPTPMGEVLPSYLWRFRKNGQFDKVVA
jgi:NADH dehydrogenase